MLTFFIFIIALLYASVGLGGGSGYLALMGIFEIDPAIMRPSALGLNILVTSIGAFKYSRAGHFRGGLFLPFAVASIPFAFLGGRITLDEGFYQSVVGIILLYAAVRLFFSAKKIEQEKSITRPPLWAALFSGALIGFISGITGVGGAIFLAPLLLLTGWATPQESAALSAFFVLVNSASGFLGHWSSTLQFPPQIIYWGVAVIIGGWVGAEYGSKKLPGALTRQILAIILFFGGGRMLMAALG